MPYRPCLSAITEARRLEMGIYVAYGNWAGTRRELGENRAIKRGDSVILGTDKESKSSTLL